MYHGLLMDRSCVTSKDPRNDKGEFLKAIDLVLLYHIFEKVMREILLKMLFLTYQFKILIFREAEGDKKSKIPPLGRGDISCLTGH